MFDPFGPVLELSRAQSRYDMIIKLVDINLFNKKL